MNLHFDDDSSMPGRARRPRSLPWSLLLLGIGYFALVAGPLLTSRIAALRWVQDLATGRAWLPAPAATGMALLGATALIFVIARLVRDVEQRPYGAIAPVLAVFSGFVLTSMRTELPLPSVGASELGILVLTLGVLGGALIGRDSWSERALGWVLALVPPIAVMSALTAVLGHANPLTMLTGADPALRMYVLMLGASSLCLGLVGAVGRSLAQRPSDLYPYGEPSVRLPRVQTSPGYGPGQMRTRTLPGVYGTQNGVGTLRPGSSSNYSRPIMADDPDLMLLTRPKRPLVRMLVVGLVIACAVAAGAYYFPTLSRDFGLSTMMPAALTPAAPATAPATPSTSATTPSSASDASRAGSTAVDTAARAGQPTAPAPTPGVAPVVTTIPLPVTAAVPLASDHKSGRSERAEADAPGAHVHRSHHSRHHRSSADASGSRTEASGAKAVAATPSSKTAKAAEPAEAAQPKKTAKVAEPVQPKATAKVAAPPVEQKETVRLKLPPVKTTTKPQTEEDLDLDMLVKKALKSSNGVSAQEDPILGL